MSPARAPVSRPQTCRSSRWLSGLAAVLLPLPGLASELPAEPSSDPPPDLRGHWQLLLRVTSHADVPILGITTVTSQTLFRAEIDGSVEAPRLHTYPCRIDTEVTRVIAQTKIPQAFIDSLPDKHFSLLLSQDESGTWLLEGDMQPQTIGYAPTASHRGVPRDLDDPRVQDTDGDGHPGATVHLDIPVFNDVELYTAQHAHTLLSGRIIDADHLAGSARVDDFEQRTLSASNRLFVSNPNVEIDQRLNTFELVRLPAELSCTQLMARVSAP